MTKHQLNKFRLQLQDMAKRIQGTANSAEEQARATIGGDDAGNLSKTPLHLGDLGSEAYSQELGATLLENAQYLQGEITAALDRIEKKTFGKCENCGKAVATQRLEAIPYARHCVACAQRLHSAHAVNLNNGRPSNWTEGMGLRADGPPSGTPGGPKEEEMEDIHAVGTPGGGSAVGGLAGTNVGRGEPDTANLEAAMGSSEFDVSLTSEPEDAEETLGEEGAGAQAFSGISGGSVGGAPANKRTAGGQK